MEPFQQVARAIYLAHFVKLGGKDFEGSPLPTWENLDEADQLFWVTSARAVVSAAVTAAVSVD